MTYANVPSPTLSLTSLCLSSILFFASQRRVIFFAIPSRIHLFHRVIRLSTFWPFALAWNDFLSLTSCQIHHLKATYILHLMFEGGFDQQRPTFLMSTRRFTKSGLFRLILIGLVRGPILAHLVVFLQIHKSFQHPRFNLRSWHTCLSSRIFYRNVCRSYRSVGVLICSLPW